MQTMIAVVGLLQLAEPTAVAASAPPPGPALEAPPRRGLGMLVTGGFLSATGGALVVTAASSFANDCNQDPEGGECWAGLLRAIIMPIGVVALAVGAPLLGAGVQQNRVWRAWQRERGVVLKPRLGRSHGTWTVGLTLRF